MEFNKALFSIYLERDIISYREMKINLWYSGIDTAILQ